MGGTGSFSSKEEFTVGSRLEDQVVDVTVSIHTRTEERKCAWNDRLEESKQPMTKKTNPW